MKKENSPHDPQGLRKIILTISNYSSPLLLPLQIGRAGKKSRPPCLACSKSYSVYDTLSNNIM